MRLLQFVMAAIRGGEPGGEVANAGLLPRMAFFDLGDPLGIALCGNAQFVHRIARDRHRSDVRGPAQQVHDKRVPHRLVGVRRASGGGGCAGRVYVVLYGKGDAPERLAHWVESTQLIHVREKGGPVPQMEKNAWIAGGIHPAQRLVHDRGGIKSIGVSGAKTCEVERLFLNHLVIFK